MPFSLRCHGGCGRRAPRPRPRPRPASGTRGGRGRDLEACGGSLASSGDSGLSSSTHTASECPTMTGTRTRVAEIGRSGARGSCGFSSELRLLVRLVAFPLPVHHEVVVGRGLLGELGHAVRACAGDRLVGRDAHRGRPRPGAARTQVSGIVQQFPGWRRSGRARAPRRRARRSPRGRRAGSRRPADRRRTCRRRPPPLRTRPGRASGSPSMPTEKRKRSTSPAQRLGRRLLDDELVVAERAASRGTRGRERTHAVVAAFGEQSERHGADRPGRAYDADTWVGAHRPCF